MTDKLTDLLEQSYQLTCYVAAALCSPRERHHDCDGNVYYIQPTTEDWWNGLREDLESLQPKLQAALAAPAQQPSGEVTDDEQDAQRYRCLRRGQLWSVLNGIGDALRADELDAAIDAARTQGRRT
ncbi:hypothetical protein [Burkholderia mayonis]|uniref:Uncharacterized protein n=1 Tax=Burkholderia mayonis TaxID=1385591 RepID=A0A1B4FVD4_9BURK|nr:hypothetical protein [Burkholderia mayonis]AOJ07626.1 hypothetical protein WS71_10105 [Burkholderia mayonis]KVE58325.1 hypothetical protein WS71_24550 [Burkholderia mayonis]